MKCSCRKEVDSLNSYFNKENKIRVTVCNECAERLGLTDKEKFDLVPLSEITSEQNKTPAPNARNS